MDPRVCGALERNWSRDSCACGEYRHLVAAFDKFPGKSPHKGKTVSRREFPAGKQILKRGQVHGTRNANVTGIFIQLHRPRVLLGVLPVRKFVEKLRNLCEILLLPGGGGLKLRYPNFHWRDYRMCLRLKAAGVDPATVIDVGANEGQFAIGALNAFPEAKIYSFEPGSRAFARLERNLATISRVALFRIALGARKESARLNLASSDQSSSLLRMHRHHRDAYPEVEEIGIEPVEVTTIASAFGKDPPEPPVLLKIDTQGFEMQVLEGAGPALSGIRWILCETSTIPMYEGETLFGQLSAWLSARGFEFVAPIEIHFDRNGSPCQFDALFRSV